jgi:hypothetical protein
MLRLAAYAKKAFVDYRQPLTILEHFLFAHYDYIFSLNLLPILMTFSFFLSLPPTSVHNIEIKSNNPKCVTMMQELLLLTTDQECAKLVSLVMMHHVLSSHQSLDAHVTKV